MQMNSRVCAQKPESYSRASGYLHMGANPVEVMTHTDSYDKKTENWDPGEQRARCDDAQRFASLQSSVISNHMLEPYG